MKMQNFNIVNNFYLSFMLIVARFSFSLKKVNKEMFEFCEEMLTLNRTQTIEIALG